MEATPGSRGPTGATIGTTGTMPAGDQEHPHSDGADRAGRFWSARRVPAALAAAFLLGASGLLLYDIVSVRAGHPAMFWRRWFTDAMAHEAVDRTWVLVGAAATMALGLWLILLAVTPGLRGLLPMRRRAGHVRAGLDRDAAALILRDRAMEVSGVQSARVRVKRHKVTVRALAHFRPLDHVHDDLDTALGTGIGELGLADEPDLAVRVRRPAKKG
jgi:hypothetical protein